MALGIRVDNNGNVYTGKDGNASSYGVPEGTETWYVGSTNTSENILNYLSGVQTNKANYELAKAQNDWNVAQWNAENEYNTPLKQLERAKEAGINPLFASIDGGKAEGLSSANLANQTAPQMDPNVETNKFNAITGALDQLLASADQMFKFQVQAKQLDQMDRQLDIADYSARSEAGYRGSVKTGQDIANKNAQRASDDTHDKNIAEVNKLKADERLTVAQAETVEKAIPYIEKMKQEEIRQIGAQISELQTREKGEAYENSVHALRSRLAKNGINPDDDFGQAFFKLCLDQPEQIGNLFNKFTSGFIQSGTDILQSNPLIKETNKIVDNLNSTINATWDNQDWSFTDIFRSKKGASEAQSRRRAKRLAQSKLNGGSVWR